MAELVLKTRKFARWANDEGITDADLCAAIDEMERGLVDANLGGNVYKKRVALQGRGKRNGGRAIIATNMGDRWLFLYGFAKNTHENILTNELVFAKKTARLLLALPEQTLLERVTAGIWRKVLCP